MQAKTPFAPLTELIAEPARGGPGGRAREPVTCGVPLPSGAVRDAGRLALCDAEGRPVPLQARALDRWADGSVRWALLDWLAGASGAFLLGTGDPAAPSPAVRAEEAEGAVAVDTGRAAFRIRRGGRFPFDAAHVGAAPAIDPERTGLRVEDAKGLAYAPRIERIALEERGPLRACVRVEGALEASGAREPLADLCARLHFFAGSATVRVALTIRNPRPARHPGGVWELGDPGSIYFRDGSLALALPAGAGAAAIRCSLEIGAPYERFDPDLEVYQDSSGGENWRSPNHVNREGRVPHAFRGYRVRDGGGVERAGLRATPVVLLERGERTIGVAARHFWQSFPKALEATAGSLTLRLFPRQFADVHELQGGEQKTHELHLAFAPDEVLPEEPLAWCRAPLVARASPGWYCASGAVPYLTPKAQDPHADYLRLVDAAIEGDDTFEKKREVVDEYGWRHFGDVYGDHEAVFHEGEAPLVSHYNDQYDPIAGFGHQFLRSGDARWWALMDELAAHVTDIDVYHTERDKAAYNGGLFWHTVHYVGAGRATHRSYPRGTCGGGPSSEHDYTSGLLLHHFLTGSALSRETALELARWTMAMEDGRRTPFRWLARGPTGLASASGSPLYHGPGRGPGNAVNTLVDAHRLTGERAYLEKAEELIRRCAHPKEEVGRLELLVATVICRGVSVECRRCRRRATSPPPSPA